MSQYVVKTAYEGRKDINRIMQHMGLETRQISPPPFFPPYSDSSEEASEPKPKPEHDIPADEETIRARVCSLRRGQQERTQRFTATTHVGGRAVVSSDEDDDGENTPSDHDGDSDNGSDWRRGQ
jgi:hypothetical protein